MVRLDYLYTTTKVATLGLFVACLLHASTAQLSYHTDSNSNSFTLKTPALQQSFSRVFGGQQQQRQQASPVAQPLQQFAQPFSQPQLPQQQQQFAQPQQYLTGQYSNAAETQSPYQQALQYAQQSYPYTPQYSTQSTTTYAGQQLAQQHYAQTLQQIQQQQQLQEQLEQQQLLQQQQHRYSTQKTAQPNQVDQLQAAYLAYQQHQQQQQQQQQLQQQQQQQQYVSQQEYQQQLLRQLYDQHRPTAPAFNAGANQQTSPIFTTSDYANYMQHQQQLAERQFGSAPTAATIAANNGLSTTPISPTIGSTSSTTEKLLGVQYSPSDKVSHVKFSSGNLQYNF